MQLQRVQRFRDFFCDCHRCIKLSSTRRPARRQSLTINKHLLTELMHHCVIQWPIRSKCGNCLPSDHFIIESHVPTYRPCCYTHNAISRCFTNVEYRLVFFSYFGVVNFEQFIKILLLLPVVYTLGKDLELFSRNKRH